MKRLHQEILGAMKRGSRIWSYGKTSWMCSGRCTRQLRTSTLIEMEECGLVEEDPEHSHHRSSGHSDIVWKLKKTES